MIHFFAFVGGCPPVTNPFNQNGVLEKQHVDSSNNNEILRIFANMRDGTDKNTAFRQQTCCVV